MSHKWLYRAIFVATLALVVAAISACLFRPAVKARGLLAAVGALEVGKSTFDDAQKLASRVGATPVGPCTPAACVWSVRVDNMGLPTEWRGAGEILSTQFEAKDSIVDQKGFVFQIGTGVSVPLVQVEEKAHWRGMASEPLFVATKTTSSDPHYQAFVKLTPEASPDVYNRFTAFNLKCFWKYGGCENAQQLLSTVEWE